MFLCLGVLLFTCTLAFADALAKTKVAIKRVGIAELIVEKSLKKNSEIGQQIAECNKKLGTLRNSFNKSRGN
jgi:hypothetical protein